MAPYQGFGSTFVQVALPVSSTASPFSAESTDARAMAIDLMRHVVQTSRRRPPRCCRTGCPPCSGSPTWRSPCTGSATAVPARPAPERWSTRAAPLIGRLVNLARLPGSGRLVAEVNALMDIAVSDPSVAEVMEVTR